MCIPNFNDTSLSTAKLLLLPISEKTAAMLEFYFLFTIWPYTSICMTPFMIPASFVDYVHPRQS